MADITDRTDAQRAKEIRDRLREIADELMGLAGEESPGTEPDDIREIAGDLGMRADDINFELGRFDALEWGDTEACR